MRQAEPGRAWQIARVQQLVGLSRRDIQRACYTGSGGVGILSPRDSSWGRRSYESADLARLFVVQQYKSRGYSLPEIKHIFEDAEGHGGYLSLLDVQIDRLREQLEEASGQLVRAEALRHAARGNTGAIARLVEDVAAHLAPHHVANDGAEPVETVRVLELLAALRNEGAQPDAARAREAVSRVAGGPAGLRALRDLMDTPGVELAVELWLGAGAYAYIQDAVEAARRAGADGEGA